MSDDPASRDALRWEIRRSLVERLRISWDGMGEMANQQRAEAAIQISTMMDEIEAMERSIRHLHLDYLDMRVRLTEANLIAAGMHDEIERLTRERDEARRRLCEELMESEGNPMFWKGAPGAAGIAERLGWDCFKEGNNPEIPDSSKQRGLDCFKEKP